MRVDVRVTDVACTLEQMMNGLLRRVVESRAQVGHRVRILQVLFQVGARSQLIDTPGIQEPDFEIGHLHKFRNHEVDASR